MNMTKSAPQVHVLQIPEQLLCHRLDLDPRGVTDRLVWTIKDTYAMRHVKEGTMTADHRQG